MRPNPWFLVPLLVLASAAVSAWQRGRVPTRADWQAATDHVRGQLAPGDGATWTPYSQAEGRLFFDGLPMVHARPLEDLDPARFDRLWVLGALGHDASRLSAPHAVLESHTFGDVSVELVRPRGPKVVGDLFAQLERTVHTRRSADGALSTCEFWSGRGWHCTLRDPVEKTRACLGQPVGRRLERRSKDPECGLDAFLHVSRDVRLIGDVPRHCVWIHPMSEATVRLAWPEAPAGDTLVVDLGFSDPMVADNYKKQLRVGPARMRILRGEAELLAFDVPAVKGWNRHEVALPAGRAPLTFEVTTTATVDAHLCMDPTIRVARPELP